MFYFFKTPWWLKKLYPSLVWHIDIKEKILYLTFDDGPHPVATPFVLDELKKYNAKATFFCIGKNVVQYPDIYKRIIDEEHRVGNHTFSHLNGWKTDDEVYIKNIQEAAKYIDSDLFRPPYGKITRFQTKLLKPHYKIIMWDVLSADFDKEVSPEKCAQQVIMKSKPGSIIVFHDSEKAMLKLEFALPKVLQYFSSKGYIFSTISPLTLSSKP
jgi:peptidoglycan/xylan/chitin deacetylase (PgdA/CDA1 family)